MRAVAQAACHVAFKCRHHSQALAPRRKRHRDGFLSRRENARSRRRKAAAQETAKSAVACHCPRVPFRVEYIVARGGVTERPKVLAC